ncbi:MAG: ATP-binding protein [Planctomycetaceae bacterium]
MQPTPGSAGDLSMGFVPVPDVSTCNSCGSDLSVASVLYRECWLDEPGMKAVSIAIPTRTHIVGTIRDQLVECDPDINVSLRISQPQICMAVEEALANAIFHGNLEIDSKLKEGGSSQFWDLAQERQARGPWKDRVVRIHKLVSTLGVWMTITDEGAGFDTRRLLDKTPDPLAMLSSGRGLVMMKAFTNDLFFNSRGNSVTMAFYAASRAESQYCPQPVTARSDSRCNTLCAAAHN